MNNELYTVAQAANYLQISEKTVRRLISAQKLVASKIGGRSWRIKFSDIENYLQSCTNETKGA